MIPQPKNQAKVPFPQAVLFDWDDTLIETWPLLYDMYQRVFKAYHTPIPDSETMHEFAVRHGRDNFVRLIGEEQGNQALKDFIKIYDDEFHQNLTPKPGAEDILIQLTEKNIPLGIVSNKNHQAMISEVHALGWEKYFKALTGRCIVGPKPSPEPVFYTLRNMQIAPSPSSVWFIGDSIVDHETAVASDCFSVAIHAHHDQGDLSVTNWKQFSEFLSKFFS